MIQEVPSLRIEFDVRLKLMMKIFFKNKKKLMFSYTKCFTLMF